MKYAPSFINDIRCRSQPLIKHCLFNIENPFQGSVEAITVNFTLKNSFAKIELTLKDKDEILEYYTIEFHRSQNNWNEDEITQTTPKKNSSFIWAIGDCFDGGVFMMEAGTEEMWSSKVLDIDVKVFCEYFQSNSNFEILSVDKRAINANLGSIRNPIGPLFFKNPILSRKGSGFGLALAKS